MSPDRDGQRRSVLIRSNKSWMIHWNRLRQTPRIVHVPRWPTNLGCRKSTIGRIWKTFGLKPHLEEGFKLSNDLLCSEQVYDVVGSSRDPPESAVVVPVDEKSPVQGLARSQPAFSMMPGTPQPRCHSCRRHSTTSLFAAIVVANGTIISSIHRRPRAVEFKKFLVKIDKTVPEHLDVHVICDNYGTHKHICIRTWSTKHPTLPHALHTNVLVMDQQG